MKSNALKILFCLYLTLFLACNKKDNNLIADKPTISVGLDEVGISGIIMSPGGYPAEAVEVDIDGKKIITKADGKFEYSGPVSNPDKVKMSISKQGYFRYTKIFTLEKNSSISGFKFYLAEEIVAGTFAATIGGLVKTSYVSLVFQPNSFTKQDGSVYQGQVTVKMPAQNALKLAGDNRGKTSINEDVIIENWGAMNLDVYDDSGKILKLNKPMSYTYNIGSQYAYLRNAVKLWGFNDANSMWEEVGNASLTGSTFTGSTYSLSYLQWGTPYPSALLRAQVKDKNLNVATDYLFGYIITQYNNINVPTSIINSNGIVLMYVKANTTSLSFISTPCHNQLDLYSTLSIPTGKTGTQNFEVNLSPYLTSFEGTVEACAFQPIKGRAEYAYEGRKMSMPLNNGSFKFNFLACGFSYLSGILVIYDEQNKVIYKNDSWVIKPGIRNNLNPISTCTRTQAGSLSVLAEGVTYTFQTPQDKIEFKIEADYSGKLYNVITALSANTKQSFYLTYAGTTPGTYTIYTSELTVPNKNYALTFGLFTPGNVVVSSYKTGNNIITGTFKTNTSLNFNLSNTSKTVEMSGSFNISQVP